MMENLDDIFCIADKGMLPSCFFEKINSKEIFDNSNFHVIIQVIDFECLEKKEKFSLLIEVDQSIKTIASKILKDFLWQNRLGQ